MPGVMAAFLFVPLSAFTQTTEQPEWCNEYVSGVNKEQACQIAIPFCWWTAGNEFGDWRIHLLQNVERYMEVPLGTRSERPAPGFLQTRIDVSQWDDIKVPPRGRIEAVRHHKNWDKPLYCQCYLSFLRMGLEKDTVAECDSATSLQLYLCNNA